MTIHDLFIIPDLPEGTDLVEGVEGLAWEHATLFASLTEVEIGSDEFVVMHKDLLQRYRECGEHLCFIQHTAMRLLQALLLSNRIALVIRQDDTTEDVSNNITTLAQIVTSCLMWVYSAYPLQWIPNDQWGYLDEETRGVEFPVTLPNGEEKEDDDNR